MVTEETTETSTNEGQTTEEVVQANMENAQASTSDDSTQTTTEEDGTSKDAPPEGQEEQFVPITQYTFRHKKHDLPPYLHDVLTKDNNREILDVFEKAKGLDIYKNRQEKIEADHGELVKVHEQVNEKLENYDREVGILNKMWNDGDKRAYVNRLHVQDNDILMMAQDILRERNLDPQARFTVEKQRQTRVQNYEQQFQPQEQAPQVDDSENRQLRAELYETKIESIINSPEYFDFAKEFDTQYGQGSFKDRILNEGYAREVRGQDVSDLHTLIRETATFVGFGQHATQTGNANPPVVANAPQRPGTIPKVRGNASAPTKKAVKTMEDLKARQKEAFANG